MYIDSNTVTLVDNIAANQGVYASLHNSYCDYHELDLDYLMKKILPDLTAAEVTGPGGGPLQVDVRSARSTI